MEKSNFGNPDLIKEQHRVSRQVELEERYGEVEKEYTIRLEYTHTYTTTEERKEVVTVKALTEEDAIEKAKDEIWADKEDVEVSDEEILAVAIPAERDTVTLDMFSK